MVPKMKKGSCVIAFDLTIGLPDTKTSSFTHSITVYIIVTYQLIRISDQEYPGNGKLK